MFGFCQSLPLLSAPSAKSCLFAPNAICVAPAIRVRQARVTAPSRTQSVCSLSRNSIVRTAVAAVTAFMLTQAPILSLSTCAPALATTLNLNSVPHRLDVPQAIDDGTLPHVLHAHWEVHSVDCSVETMLLFSNHSPGVVDLWWVDYCGREVFYASISPGTTRIQPSFVTHPWVVRDHLSQNRLLVLVATNNPLMAVVNSSSI